MDTPSLVIAIASDHAGLALKTTLARHLADKGYEVIDLGTDSDASVDYPDFANKMAETIAQRTCTQGVLICGSGIGISIAANRHRHIRAALCTTPEMAMLSRQHNDANVLVLGARIVNEITAKQCVDQFLSTDFEGGRHSRRVEKLT